jgi:3-deoxy-D-manno-octulosonate 8-phosphate phosphatase (KDO 8-P phosphatase)
MSISGEYGIWWRMNKITESEFKKIELFALDFDGVFTDNKVYISENGSEYVKCDRGDSLGLKLLMIERPDINVVVISRESSKVVTARCNKLGIPAYHPVFNKLNKLKEIADELKIDKNRIAYIGNDVQDIECIKYAGIGIAVWDSHNRVMDVADWITTHDGGNGAIREICDLILKEI